ncbi:hypothetical protein KHA94_03040 [Bacillus sp. FJAT-49705]|uniref:DUF4350 domain-containing protein n=1 Tax=Cytobacillus citreus TaxID=2833586 RepID=A0ABS5NP14_9BACI|nr:hypothetical protein [Cytobacillus citreus]MBS4189194.1 hypothetical protein [Cytobacillus citreus]
MHKISRFVIILILSLILSINLFLPIAKADGENINITLEEGFNGKIKMGKGFPLTIKLDNSGEAFSGNLLINFNPSWNTGGAISIKVDLPANNSKTYQISMPGLTEDHPYSYQNIPTVQLYKGDWRKGKTVKFKGEDKIKPKYIDMNENVIGVLSENFDRLKELRILPNTQVQLIELKKEELPKQTLGLEMLDYLLIDEYAISQLDEEQQLAIKEWIEAGGVLVAGASPNGSQSYGQLYSLLPMKMEEEVSVSADFLLTKDNGKKPEFSELKIFTGPLNEDAIIVDKNGNIPTTVKKNFGEGMILQTGFSIGDEPLSSWKGYSTWFANFINEAEVSKLNSMKYGPDFYGSLYWEFVETNEFFPASNFSIGQLIGLLGGYIIIIVPVLYFVLKKLDKREHSWWIIPSLSIIMAAIVFGIGAKDRISKPQLNQLGVYMAEDQHLTGLQASTLLSNKSGQYTLSIPKGQFNAVTSTQNMRSLDQMSGAIYEEKRKNTDIVFPEVGYWSSKTIYGKAHQKVDGGFVSDLKLKNSQLTGTIQNGFDYDFEEVFIWSGKEKIKLGKLKKGEKIQVNKKINLSLLTKPYASGGPNFSYQNTDIDKMKRERLEYVASNFIFNSNKENEPIIGGFTKDAIVDVKMLGKKEKQDNTNLILESFNAEQEFSGEFTLKNEMLSTNINVISGRIAENMINGSNREIMIEDGEYEYIVLLPKQLVENPTKLNELTIKTNNQFIQYSVFNSVTGEWLSIDTDKPSFTMNETNHIQQFVTKEGEIKIKLIKNAKGDPYVQLPNITIKGEVTP